ncbi:MAG: hypothetical protein C5B55_08410, partial [Blastocatellia bacterium]
MRLALVLLLLILSLTATSVQTQLKSTPKGLVNRPALNKFLAALTAAKGGTRLEPVRIMHFGDSHVAADVLTRNIRSLFQNEFGDAGPGFIVPRNPMSTRRVGVLSGASDGWVIEGIGGRTSPDNIYGPAGIDLATSNPGELAWLETSCNHFEIYFVRLPGGGRMDVAIDGVTQLDAPINLTAPKTQLDSLSFDLPDDTVHRIEVRTLNSGRIRLLGIVAEHLTPAIAYDVFGINGARANRILGWNQAALTKAIKERNPNLIIIAYGTNELTDDDWTAASYEALLATIIQRFQAAAPQASILVFAPPDRADLPLNNRLRALIEAE